MSEDEHISTETGPQELEEQPETQEQPNEPEAEKFSGEVEADELEQADDKIQGIELDDSDNEEDDANLLTKTAFVFDELDDAATRSAYFKEQAEGQIDRDMAEEEEGQEDEELVEEYIEPQALLTTGHVDATLARFFDKSMYHHPIIESAKTPVVPAPPMPTVEEQAKEQAEVEKTASVLREQNIDEVVDFMKNYLFELRYRKEIHMTMMSGMNIWDNTDELFYKNVEKFLRILVDYKWSLLEPEYLRIYQTDEINEIFEFFGYEPIISNMDLRTQNYLSGLRLWRFYDIMEMVVPLKQQKTEFTQLVKQYIFPDCGEEGIFPKTLQEKYRTVIIDKVKSVYVMHDLQDKFYPMNEDILSVFTLFPHEISENIEVGTLIHEPKLQGTLETDMSFSMSEETVSEIVINKYVECLVKDISIRNVTRDLFIKNSSIKMKGDSIPEFLKGEYNFVDLFAPLSGQIIGLVGEITNLIHLGQANIEIIVTKEQRQNLFNTVMAASSNSEMQYLHKTMRKVWGRALKKLHNYHVKTIKGLILEEGERQLILELQNSYRELSLIAPFNTQSFPGHVIGAYVQDSRFYRSKTGGDLVFLNQQGVVDDHFTLPNAIPKMSLNQKRPLLTKLQERCKSEENRIVAIAVAVDSLDTLRLINNLFSFVMDFPNAIEIVPVPVISLPNSSFNNLFITDANFSLDSEAKRRAITAALYLQSPLFLYSLVEASNRGIIAAQHSKYFTSFNTKRIKNEGLMCEALERATSDALLAVGVDIIDKDQFSRFVPLLPGVPRTIANSLAFDDDATTRSKILKKLTPSVAKSVATAIRSSLSPAQIRNHDISSYDLMDCFRIHPDDYDLIRGFMQFTIEKSDELLSSEQEQNKKLLESLEMSLKDQEDARDDADQQYGELKTQLEQLQAQPQPANTWSMDDDHDPDAMQRISIQNQLNAKSEELNQLAMDCDSLRQNILALKDEASKFTEIPQRNKKHVVQDYILREGKHIPQRVTEEAVVEYINAINEERTAKHRQLLEEQKEREREELEKAQVKKLSDAANENHLLEDGEVDNAPVTMEAVEEEKEIVLTEEDLEKVQLQVGPAKMSLIVNELNKPNSLYWSNNMMFHSPTPDEVFTIAAGNPISYYQIVTVTIVKQLNQEIYDSSMIEYACICDDAPLSGRIMLRNTVERYTKVRARIDINTFNARRFSVNFFEYSEEEEAMDTMSSKHIRIKCYDIMHPKFFNVTGVEARERLLSDEALQYLIRPSAMPDTVVVSVRYAKDIIANYRFGIRKDRKTGAFTFTYENETYDSVDNIASRFIASLLRQFNACFYHPKFCPSTTVEEVKDHLKQMVEFKEGSHSEWCLAVVKEYPGEICMFVYAGEFRTPVTLRAVVSHKGFLFENQSYNHIKLLIKGFKNTIRTRASSITQQPTGMVPVEEPAAVEEEEWSW
ncbi:hypothetical protein PCE1_002911 [Barthelona sp. PCE]